MENWEQLATDFAVASTKADETLKARFFDQPVLDQDATKASGRPIYVDKTFIEITLPQSGEQQVFRANSQHYRRFPKHFAWFEQQKKEGERVEGTLITRWNQIDPKKAAELRHRGFLTVERLAELEPGDANLSEEDLAIVAMAKDFIAGVTEKEKEIARLRAELEEAQKPRRGRPPKTEESEAA